MTAIPASRPMPEILEHGFMIRALAAGLIVGTLCAALSVIIVLKRLSFAGVGVSHSAFGGLALGALFGVNLEAAAFAFSAAVALVTSWMIRRGGVSEDVSVGIIFATSMAIGVAALGLMEGYTIDLFSYLFGSILAVSPRDLWLAGGALVIGLAAFLALFNRLIAYCFDEEWARVSGVNVDRLEDALMILVAMTVVISIKLLGIVLVSALLVIPGATGYALARHYRGMMAISIASALAAVTAGLVISYYLDIASGAAIVLSSAALFLFASLGGRARRA